MYSSAIVIMGAPEKVNQIYIHPISNINNQIKVNLNTTQPDGISNIIDLSLLKVPNGTPLGMFLIKDGTKIQLLNADGKWIYNKYANAQILKVNEININTYVVTQVSQAYNSVICINKGSLVASFSFIDLSPDKKEDILYKTNYLSVNNSTTVKPSQVGNLKTVEIKANITLGKSSSYKPLLICSNSPLVAGIVLLGTSFSPKMQLIT